MNRTLTGVLATVCLLGGFTTWVLHDEYEMLAAALIRVGLLLAAFWYALPTRTREAAWANVHPVALVGFLVAALVFAARPRILLYVAPLVVVLAVIGYFLKPRPKRRPPRPSSSPKPPEPARSQHSEPPA